MAETANCTVCAFANEHGWWGQSGTHCRGCHRSWTGHRECHCMSCHRHFTSPTLFDAHLKGGTCREPKGGVLNEQGVWHYPGKGDWVATAHPYPQSGESEPGAAQPRKEAAQ
jgi:hypothetical protein